MNRNLYLAPVIVVITLVITAGIFNLISAFNFVYSGMYYDGNCKVTKVVTNSPAEKAGVLVGDSLLTYNGEKLTANITLGEQDGYKIGNKVEFRAERNGEIKSFQVVLEPEPAAFDMQYIGLFAMGLIYMLCGLFAHFNVKSKLSLLFVLFTMVVGFLLGTQLIIANKIILTIYIVFNSFMPALLMHFLLIFPPKSKFLSKKINTLYLYLPSLAILLAELPFVFPGTYESNMFINIIIVVLYIGYIIAVLLTLIVKYIKAATEYRKKGGGTLLLISIIIGLAVLVAAIFSQTNFIWFAVVSPVLIGLSIIKQARFKLE